MARDPHPTLPKPHRPEPPPGTPEHAEWLLDEASEESFPASDSPTPAHPGSTHAVKKLAAVGRKTPRTEEELAKKK